MNLSPCARIADGVPLWETWLEGPEVAEVLRKVKAAEGQKSGVRSRVRRFQELVNKGGFCLGFVDTKSFLLFSFFKTLWPIGSTIFVGCFICVFLWFFDRLSLEHPQQKISNNKEPAQIFLRLLGQATWRFPRFGLLFFFFHFWSNWCALKHHLRWSVSENIKCFSGHKVVGGFQCVQNGQKNKFTGLLLNIRGWTFFWGAWKVNATIVVTW